MKLIINDDFSSWAVEVYLQVTSHTGVTVYGQEDGVIKPFDIKPGDAVDIKPIFKMQRTMFDDFVRLIADHAANKNLVTETGSYQKGKLEATEKNLVATSDNFNMLLKAYINLADPAPITITQEINPKN